MKVVFIKSRPEFKSDNFTQYKVYDAVIDKYIKERYNVFDDKMQESVIFKDEFVELEEYKKQLIKERYEQQ